MLSNKRPQSGRLLEGERSLAARALKIPWANTPILESVNNMFGKTMGASVMLGEAREGVHNRPTLQFKQCILAFQCIAGLNTTQCSNKCHIHTESLSPPIFRFNICFAYKQSKLYPLQRYMDSFLQQ